MTLKTDNFTGTDGQLLTARTDWAQRGGGTCRAVVNASNQIKSVAGGDASTVCVDTGANDMYAQCVALSDFGTDDGLPLVLRVTDRNSYVGARFNSTSNLWEIFTQFGRVTSVAGSYTSGDVIRFEIVSDVATIKKNGSTVLTDTVPTITASNYAGIFLRIAKDPVMDDWESNSIGGGAQTLEPPLLTNTPTIYAPTVTGGAVPQTLSPPLLTNTPTLYAPTVAVVGFKASYILANTGPVGANPAGSMYEVAGLVDPDDYMTYTTVSGPTPSGGTLVEYPDGTFEYTGGAPAIWVIQIKINGVDYPETTTIYLYDQEFTLLPPLLVNTPTIYAPTVSVNGTVVLQPPLLTNTPTLYAPTVTRGAGPLPPAGEPGDKNTPSGMIGFWNR